MRFTRNAKRKRPWDVSTFAMLSVLFLSFSFTPTVSSADDIFRQANNSNFTKAPSMPTPEITKDSAPFVFDMRLNVTNSVNFNNLLSQLNNVIEFYLFDQLYPLGMEMQDVVIRNVTVEVTLLMRRQLRQLQSNTQLITVEVDGACHYEVDVAQLDLMEVKGDILTEVDSLLNLKNMGTFIEDADIDDVVLVSTISISNLDDDKEGSNDDTNNPSTAENKLKKPSTLSMVFGFVLLFLTILSLLGYVYMFAQKRQKRRLKKERIKQMMPPRKHPKVSPNQQFFPSTPQQKPATAMNIMPAASSTSSDTFSFQDPNSTKAPAATGKDDNKVVESFAEELEGESSDGDRELETANKNSFGGNFIDMNDENKTTETGLFNSLYSHYGDTARVAGDFHLDDVSDWEPYGPSKAEEKKEDAWGTASAFSVGSIPASAFSQEGFDVDMSNDNMERGSVASSEASSMMLEVQKLSKYVQRYEKRKERKALREKERVERKSDDGGLDLDYLKNLKPSLNRRSHSTGRESNASFDRSSAARSTTTLKEAGATLTSQLLSKSRTPPGSQGLGKSPFNHDAETAEEEEYEQQRPRNIFPDHNNAQPRRRTKSDGDRPQYNFSKHTTNATSLRGYQAVMENRKKLASLRSNTAIIDSSKSDVNVGGFNPRDDQYQTNSGPSESPTPTHSFKPVTTAESTGAPVRRWTPSSKPITPEPATTPERQWSAPKPRSNSKFSSARDMFENKSQAAVFPPGQRLF
eukprot:scaffold5024_cov136-Cylindrotheca_fusiformis.AAC.31